MTESDNTKEIIAFFCRKTGLKEPVHLDQVKKIMERMISCGVLSKEEM